MVSEFFWGDPKWFGDGGIGAIALAHGETPWTFQVATNLTNMLAFHTPALSPELCKNGRR